MVTGFNVTAPAPQHPAPSRQRSTWWSLKHLVLGEPGGMLCGPLVAKQPAVARNDRATCRHHQRPPRDVVRLKAHTHACIGHTIGFASTDQHPISIQSARPCMHGQHTRRVGPCGLGSIELRNTRFIGPKFFWSRSVRTSQMFPRSARNIPPSPPRNIPPSPPHPCMHAWYSLPVPSARPRHEGGTGTLRTPRCLDHVGVGIVRTPIDLTADGCRMMSAMYCPGVLSNDATDLKLSNGHTIGPQVGIQHGRSIVTCTAQSQHSHSTVSPAPWGR